MAANKNQKGFAHLVVLLIVFASVGLVSSSLIPITRSYSSGSGNVQGVNTAELNVAPKSLKIIPHDTPETDKFKEIKGKIDKQAEEIKIHEGDMDYSDEKAMKELEDELNELENEIASSEGQRAFYKNNAAAVSKFPLKIGSDSGRLIAKTGEGEKSVTVLPAHAIRNMLASGVMDYVDSEKMPGELASVKDVVKLEERDGVLGYEIEGDRKHSLLGIFDLKTRVKTFVSAENGEVVNTTQSFFGRILNRIAP